MRLNPGEKYYLTYTDWQHDPAPYLYVTWSDGKYTSGFNLHYLPQIRFRIPLEAYKRVNEKTWAKSFENMKNAGMFRGFLDILDKASERKMSKSAYKGLVTMIQHKHKWAMQAYRVYHSPMLRKRTVK